MSFKSNRTDGLTPVQESAISAMLSTSTISEAAKVSGAGERSIYRWLRDDYNFRSAYTRMRREAFSAAAGAAQRLAPEALLVLAKIMRDETANTSARVTAAMGVLKFGRDALELDDLKEKIVEIEKCAASGVPWSTGTKINLMAKKVGVGE